LSPSREAETPEVVPESSPSCEVETPEVVPELGPSQETEARRKKSGQEKPWEKHKDTEDSVGTPWQLSASEKNKKRNQSRRLRRRGTQARLAHEPKEEEERRIRCEEKEEKRRKRRLFLSKAPKKIPSSEGPVLIQTKEGTNRRRLLRRSDAKSYAVRSCQGRTRRIWVKACWLGLCSARRHMKEQEKGQRSRQIQRFLRQAICFDPRQLKVESNWAEEFIRKPYFLRPEFLPSGRATPETAKRWKAEDELSCAKEDRKWRSVEEGHAARYRRGNAWFVKASTAGLKRKEELSYLTVSSTTSPSCTSLRS
jgi:hypothetical protein